MSGRPRPIRKEDLPGWAERRAALRYLPAFVGLVWRTSRGLTVSMGALRLVRAFLPLAMLWIGKLIIDAVVAMRESGPDYERLALLVGVELGLVLVADALARASALVESLLGDLFSNRVSVMLMEHAATLDLAQFEDPAFYDQLDRARRQTTGRIGLFARLFQMAQDTITLVSLAAALAIYSPVLLLLLAVAVVPSFLGETHFASLEYSLLYRWTPERRQLDYLRYAGASDVTAKEVQLFGLAPWLTARYRELSDRFYRENRKLSIRKAIVASLLAMLGTLGYYAAYAVILFRAVTNTISVGTLTFLAASFAQSRDLIQRILLGASDVVEQSLYLKDLFGFFEVRPTISSPPDARPVPDPIREGFVFEDVGFQYPGSERWAVRGVSFTLAPGERIALVGENGAGKTTITKLIARLYDPTEGRVLLDGVDLREYDLTSLRRAIAVIFQDFVRYDLAFDENIGVGEIEEARDYLDRASTNEDDVEVPDRIRSAADKSLAASLLPRLKSGYRQMLGRRFEGGVALSGGEWQKVALARAYMRRAQLLILDEPTAALDARAEYEVFERFSELVAGRMAVLISHRFSTVRMADRIVVMKDGTVVETGTHDELVRADGLYAELFQLQAAGYR